MDWHPYATRLAEQVARPASRWHAPVAATPRHLLVPRWWTRGPHNGWTLHLQDSPAEETEHLDAAYRDQTLVTQVGPAHADHATPGDHPTGRPTSSSTLPSLLVRMYRHADIEEGCDILDVGTGSGYGAALLTSRLGDQRVTSIDVDPYLVKVAIQRLDTIGLHPQVRTCDTTGLLPDTGAYDRIVATVAVRPIPASWLTALRPGGRLATVISDTTLIVTANKTPDGGAVGRIERDRAGFMTTRTRPDPADDQSGLAELLVAAQDREGDVVTQGRYPVLDVDAAWEVYSMLSITAPGIEHHYEEDADGRRTAWMLHPDGSWTRATAASMHELPIVHQDGPRRLMDELDRIRHRQLATGQLPVYGAKVRIDPDGTCHLTRGRWEATIA